MSQTFNKGEKYMLFVYAKTSSAGTASWYSISDASAHKADFNTDFDEVASKDIEALYSRKVCKGKSFQVSCDHFDTTGGAGLTYKQIRKMDLEDLRPYCCYTKVTTDDIDETKGWTPDLTTAEFFYGKISSLSRTDNNNEKSTYSINVVNDGAVSQTVETTLVPVNLY